MDMAVQDNDSIKKERQLHHYRLEWYDSHSATRTDSGQSGVCSENFEPNEKHLIFDRVKGLMNQNTVRWRDLRLWKVYSDLTESFEVFKIGLYLDD